MRPEHRECTKAIAYSGLKGFTCARVIYIGNLPVWPDAGEKYQFSEVE